MKTAYEKDLNLWFEETVKQLRARDFEHLDIDNLVEEIEGLAGRDRRELINRLETLLEHILKRCYVEMPDCFNGWERTIREQRRQLKLLLSDSPSLKNVFEDKFDDAWQFALETVRADYPHVDFPNTWEGDSEADAYSRTVDAILAQQYWD